ncbi:Hpt domain-containing protein [Maridesulfovibrio hydrothermalis]|uniref:Hpt protein n=1 Tax=Maridesulfovibrio hydrothermalis AM13 = DSM 14728 TaxID=1121451 RepID=L0R9D5_9BACT|nr:Hpt domain-containing protein [Maridesulfovibrio hydrothermalis]CCO23368.1 Hpt protein [Maridesulfovibrio hydrothermalis AM13 = DSM 14728]
MNFNDDSGRFDLESALERFSGDSELLGEAIAIFKEEAARHLVNIKLFLTDGQIHKVVAEAHTLKAECGAVGAVAAQFLSGSLEKAALNIDHAASQELFLKVEEEVNTAIEELPDS